MTQTPSAQRSLPRGSLPALVTPMRRDGGMDTEAFRSLLDRQADHGSSGVIVAGSTGEGAALSDKERRQLIATAVDHVGGRIDVIAGCAATVTTSVIQQAIEARDAGAHAILVSAPAYSRPTQEGLYQHFRSVAEAASSPLIVYNIPNRTGVDIENDTVLRLADIPHIVGLKDATGDVGRIAHLMDRTPEGFALYSGDDRTAAALMLLGAHGVISVAANVVPKAISELCSAALAGNANETRRLNQLLAPLFDALGAESNPIPVKYVLARQGLCEDFLRLPLTPLSEKLHPHVDDALANIQRAFDA